MKIVIGVFILPLLLLGQIICVNAQSGNEFMVFALDGKALIKNKAAIKNNDVRLIPAYKQLIKEANAALAWGPHSVMEKTNIPPSGDKHDYMSLAPYHWPDPAKADGLPYIRKDGQTNPEVKDYKDKEYLPKLCENVQILGLAYYFSDNPEYAEHAGKLLKVWFLNEATKMNPNLNYGQAMKGWNEGRGAGLIDTRHFIKLIDGLQLLRNSKSWKESDTEAMKQWFSAFLQWMQTSKNGVDESKAKNNHGDWYDAQRLAMACFIDSNELAKKVVASAINRLDYQMDKDGFFPAEMARTISLHYSAFALEAFMTIAQIATTVHLDFWTYQTPSGKSLKKGFDALKPYFAGEKKWDGEQIKPYEFKDSYRILMEGSKHFSCPDCAQKVQQLAGEKGPRLMINLLY